MANGGRTQTLVRGSYPVQQEHKEYLSVVRELCAPNSNASLWLEDVFRLAMLWDHIVDGDPVDVDEADKLFESILLTWPANPFYTQFGLLLTPLLSSIISTWRASNSGDAKANDCLVYVDLPLSVAFLLGGAIWRDKFDSKIRHLSSKMRDLDNDREKGE